MIKVVNGWLARFFSSWFTGQEITSAYEGYETLYYLFQAGNPFFVTARMVDRLVFIIYLRSVIGKVRCLVYIIKRSAQENQESIIGSDREFVYYQSL